MFSASGYQCIHNSSYKPEHDLQNFNLTCFMAGLDSLKPESSCPVVGAKNLSDGSLTDEWRMPKNSSMRPSYVSCVISGDT